MTRTRIPTDGIADASVTTAKIVDAAVTTAKLADSNVTTAKIADSAITTAKIANDAVVTADILNSNVTYAKIQNVAANTLLGRSSAGAGVVEEVACTAQGRSLISGADAAAQRATLGLGTMATAATTSYLAVAGGTMTGALVAAAGTAGAPGIAVGTATNGLLQPTTNTVGVATNGVERWRVGSDGATQSVIPGGSTLLPQFQCRAWVNFNGTGTIAIRGSGNVTSITDGGVGTYTINFTTAMPDANYAPVTALSVATGIGPGVARLQGTYSTAALGVICTDCANGLYDPAIVSVAVFR